MQGKKHIYLQSFPPKTFVVYFKRPCCFICFAYVAVVVVAAVAAAVVVVVTAAVVVVTAAGYLTFLPRTSLESSLYALARQPCMALRYLVTAERRAGAELAFKRWLRSVAVRGRGLDRGEKRFRKTLTK